MAKVVQLFQAENFFMAEIAIIGAGMGGLSALHRLTAAGHNVTLFDKSRGSGGRMATKKVGDASWDMGAQFMRAHSSEFAEQLQAWQEQGWIARWQAEPPEWRQGQITPSADAAERYVGMPRMTGLSRQLLSNAHQFIDSTRIISAAYQADGWHLRSDDEREFGPFAGLIINTPPQQATPLLTDSPALQQQCEQVDMLPCWTLLLTLPKPLNLPDMVFVKEGPLGFIARNNSKPGRDPQEAWVLQASHEWSQQQVDSPREQVQQQLLDAFAQISGADLSVAENLWLHRWLYAIPDTALTLGALTDLSQNLAVCGDWCHSPSLEGAWLSGQRAATSLLTTLNGYS